MSVKYEPGTEGLTDPRPAEDERDAIITALQAALESFAKSMNELKKERDEAREAFAIATDQAVQAQCKTREALRERDEAREERDIARLERDEAIADYQRVYKERDDLREELCHLRACVFDALSALDAGAFVELKKAWEEGAK